MLAPAANARDGESILDVAVFEAARAAQPSMPTLYRRKKAASRWVIPVLLAPKKREQPQDYHARSRSQNSRL